MSSPEVWAHNKDWPLVVIIDLERAIGACPVRSISLLCLPRRDSVILGPKTSKHFAEARS